MLVGTMSPRGVMPVQGPLVWLSRWSGALRLTSLRLPAASVPAPSLPDTAEPG